MDRMSMNISLHTKQWDTVTFDPLPCEHCENTGWERVSMTEVKACRCCRTVGEQLPSWPRVIPESTTAICPKCLKNFKWHSDIALWACIDCNRFLPPGEHISSNLDVLIYCVQCLCVQGMAPYGCLRICRKCAHAHTLNTIKVPLRQPTNPDVDTSKPRQYLHIEFTGTNYVVSGDFIYMELEQCPALNAMTPAEASIPESYAPPDADIPF